MTLEGSSDIWYNEQWSSLPWLGPYGALLSFIFFWFCNFIFDVFVKIILSKDERNPILPCSEVFCDFQLILNLSVWGHLIQEVTKNWNFSKWKVGLTRRCAWLRRVGWSTWFLEIPNLHPSNIDCKVSISVEFLVLVFCSFLVQGQTRAWISRRFNHPKDLIQGSIYAF